MARRSTWWHAFLVWAHRWLGLTVGVIFTILSVSGSALLFQRQYWEWAHGDLTPPGMSADIGSIDRWIEQGKKAVPDLGEPIAIWPPHVEHNLGEAGMLIFAGRKPGGLGNMGFAAVLVAPATGDVLGVVDVDRSPAYAPLFLHRDLWAGQTGQVISAIMAIGTFLLLVIGIYLWWPPWGQFVRRLLGKPWRSLKQARPLHDWVGVWTLIVLSALVASGLALVRPAWVEPALNAVAGPEPEEPPLAAACAGPVTFDAALARASALVPGGRFKSLYPIDFPKVLADRSSTAQPSRHAAPADAGASESRRWELVLEPEGAAGRRGESHVLVDRECGGVTLEATPATRSGHETASMWLSDIHDGAAFGRGGPLFVSLMGLSPLVLLWSGILLWLRRPRRSTARNDLAA
jgi:uncharacterized iron-regulated membrane protein